MGPNPQQTETWKLRTNPSIDCKPSTTFDTVFVLQSPQNNSVNDINVNNTSFYIHQARCMVHEIRYREKRYTLR